MGEENILIPDDSQIRKSKKNGLLNGENQNKGSQHREERWLTPNYLVDALGKFDLDPCGAPNHDLAEHTFLLENGDDGLRDKWYGRVWLNPPYGKKAEPFIAKLAEHGNGIALIFARTETQLWFNEIWNKADAVFFIKGRIFFLDKNGQRASSNAGAPSAFVAYGEENVEALKNSEIEGQLVILNNQTTINDNSALITD